MLISSDRNMRATSTLGIVFTREGAEEYYATNFPTKCKGQVLRVPEDITPFAETHVGFAAHSTVPAAGTTQGPRH